MIALMEEKHIWDKTVDIKLQRDTYNERIYPPFVHHIYDWGMASLSEGLVRRKSFC